MRRQVQSKPENLQPPPKKCKIIINEYISAGVSSMSDNGKIYKGNIVFTKEAQQFSCYESGYIVVKGGKVVDVFDRLPEAYAGVEVIDFENRLIIPGFVDMHLHAPQFNNIGIGYDKELLPWLTAYTFPEESKFADASYAEEVYAQFVDELVRHGTTRAVIFATVHTAATEKLFEILAARGLGAFVGRVNMDRNGDCLTENTADSLQETEEWIKQHLSPEARIRPIITPRFTPSCTDELMQGLGELAAKYNIPVQSHISENLSEIEWVKELVPAAKHYADTYDRFGLFGQTPTVMAQWRSPAIWLTSARTISPSPASPRRWNYARRVSRSPS